MRQLSLLRVCAAVAAVSLGTALAAPAKAPPPNPAPPQNQAVEPEALAALGRMGAYLRTLQSFEIKADTTRDVVLDNGQKLQFTGKTNYKVRRPNGFVIAVADDRKVRQFYYDGKSFTVYAPRMNFYATVGAPPTIREMLKAAYDKFDIELPLEDLFGWGLPGDDHADLIGGVRVGYARINGADTDQYAFREDGVDWQIWIQRGARPLPLKAVITTTDDEARPEYAAVLSWNTAARFTDGTFAFKAPASAKPITIANR